MNSHGSLFFQNFHPLSELLFLHDLVKQRDDPDIVIDFGDIVESPVFYRLNSILHIHFFGDDDHF